MIIGKLFTNNCDILSLWCFGGFWLLYTLSHQMHIINGTFPILCSLVSMDGYWNTLPFLLVVVNFLNLLLG